MRLKPGFKPEPTRLEARIEEQVADAAIRLREASLAAVAADAEDLVMVSDTHIQWMAADAAFKLVVDKLRRLRGRTRKVAK